MPASLPPTPAAAHAVSAYPAEDLRVHTGANAGDLSTLADVLNIVNQQNFH